MRLGYGARGVYRLADAHGFNEAEAHAPRILCRPAALRLGLIRFNEAEAHAPRIQACP